MPDLAARGAAAPHGGADGGVLRVGSWNLTGWSAERATVIASAVPVDVLAIQETHLAPLAVEKAHTTARNAGLCLHHGRPASGTARRIGLVPAVSDSSLGRASP
jgi:hypothetical protein